MGKTRPRAAKLVHLISLSIELIALYYMYMYMYMYMHSLPYLVNKTGVRAVRHLYTCPVFFVFIHVQPCCSDEILLQLAFFSLFKTSNREIESIFSYFWGVTFSTIVS